MYINFISRWSIALVLPFVLFRIHTHLATSSATTCRIKHNFISFFFFHFYSLLILNCTLIFYSPQNISQHQPRTPSTICKHSEHSVFAELEPVQYPPRESTINSIRSTCTSSLLSIPWYLHTTDWPMRCVSTIKCMVIPLSLSLSLLSNRKCENHHRARSKCGKREPRKFSSHSSSIFLSFSGSTTQPQYIYFKVNTESLFVMGSVNVLSSLRVCVSLCVCPVRGYCCSIIYYYATYIFVCSIWWTRTRVMSISIYFFNGNARLDFCDSIRGQRRLSEWVSLHTSPVECHWICWAGRRKKRNECHRRGRKWKNVSSNRWLGLELHQPNGATKPIHSKAIAMCRTRVESAVECAWHSWKCINYVCSDA